MYSNLNHLLYVLGEREGVQSNIEPRELTWLAEWPPSNQNHLRALRIASEPPQYSLHVQQYYLQYVYLKIDNF